MAVDDATAKIRVRIFPAGALLQALACPDTVAIGAGRTELEVRGMHVPGRRDKKRQDEKGNESERKEKKKKNREREVKKITDRRKNQKKYEANFCLAAGDSPLHFVGRRCLRRAGKNDDPICQEKDLEQAPESLRNDRESRFAEFNALSTPRTNGKN